MAKAAVAGRSTRWISRVRTPPRRTFSSPTTSYRAGARGGTNAMGRFSVHALLGLTLATAALPTAHAAESRLPWPADTRPVVSLVWFDPTDALPVPASVVAAEVAALFTAWGIEVQWRVGEAGITPAELSEIKVVVQRE